MLKKLPAHPGVILRDDFLIPTGMSATDLALALNVPPAHVNAILKGKQSITAETALRLSRYFGTTPKFWMTLQVSYELGLARRRRGHAVMREVQPRAWLKWSLTTARSQRILT